MEITKFYTSVIYGATSHIMWCMFLLSFHKRVPTEAIRQPTKDTTWAFALWLPKENIVREPLLSDFQKNLIFCQDWGATPALTELKYKRSQEAQRGFWAATPSPVSSPWLWILISINGPSICSLCPKIGKKCYVRKRTGKTTFCIYNMWGIFLCALLLIS